MDLSSFKGRAIIAGAAAALLIGLIVGINLSRQASLKKLQTNIVTENYLSQDDLVSFMTSQGVSTNTPKAIADANYALPAKRWLETNFSTAYSEFITQLHENKWVNEENDCDDFARSCAFFSQLLHHNTVRKLPNVGLALGEFWYVRAEDGFGHAINFVIVIDSDTKKPKLLFYEPQTRKIIDLNKEEISSCLFWRI